jgi:hypothetical protein
VNTNALLGGLMVAATSLGLFWQDTQAPASPGSSEPAIGLQPIPATQGGGLQPLHVDDQAPTDWRSALSAADFGARTEAFHQALDLVPRDAAFRDSLQAWAADKGDPELAWTAHLLLDMGQRNGAQRTPFGGFGNPFGGGLFESFFGQAPLFAPPTAGRPSAPFQSNMSWIEADSDGVRMHVETWGPDGKQVETYEADTLEQLKAEHPELFQGRDRDLSFGSGLFGGAPFGAGIPQLPTLPAFGAVRTDVLGVMIAPQGSQGQSDGLLVESVVPNTIASELGVQAGDTIVRINERAVQSRADIAAELAARGAHEVVELEWIDAAGERVVQSWNP